MIQLDINIENIIKLIYLSTVICNIYVILLMGFEIRKRSFQGGYEGSMYFFI